MNLRLQAMAAATLALLASCGSSSSDKKTTDDTATTTTTTANVDNTTMNVRTVTVPVPTKTSFEAKYPQASNVRWEYYRPDMTSIEWDWSGWPTIDTADYVANFNWDNNDYWAWYDQDGNWIGTTSRITNNSSLPASVNGTLTKEYNGYNVVTIDKENDKNRTAYEIQLDNGTEKVKVLVDENGKIMKKKVISGDSKTKEKVNPKDTAQ